MYLSHSLLLYRGLSKVTTLSDASGLRKASLTSAINRGIRRTRNSVGSTIDRSSAKGLVPQVPEQEWRAGSGKDQKGYDESTKWSRGSGPTANKQRWKARSEEDRKERYKSIRQTMTPPRRGNGAQWQRNRSYETPNQRDSDQAFTTAPSVSRFDRNQSALKHGNTSVLGAETSVSPMIESGAQSNRYRRDAMDPAGDGLHADDFKRRGIEVRNHRSMPNHRDKQVSREYPLRTHSRPNRLDKLGKVRSRSRFPEPVQRNSNDREEPTESLAPKVSRHLAEHLGFSGKAHVKVPLFIPYTIAGSEFIYGTNSVKAALQSGRRKLYKLYIYTGDSATNKDNSIYKLALAAGVPVSKVTGDWDKLMSKMSDQRPHNGYVLEATPLPKLPVTALENLKTPAATFQVVLGHQSAEEQAANSTFAMDGSLGMIPSVGGTDRFPFVLMLDGVLDPGNLGAIIRSAYFLGVDALAVLEHGTAPLGPVTLKSSSGAAEYMSLITVRNEVKFVKQSQANGWNFFAAMSPDSSSSPRNGMNRMTLEAIGSTLAKGPCVLMLGNEGDGIRPQLHKLANGVVGIKSARKTIPGLDSLNVSVAAALLVQCFVSSHPYMERDAVKEVTQTESKSRLF